MSDLSKEHLYKGVKKLVETNDQGNPHLHLSQQKLFTLFSIAFQFLLFRSTKEPGSYIIRVENSSLLERISKKAKDTSTRRFLQSMLLPRKVKYTHSSFYLDFFHPSSWNMTRDIPKEKLKGGLIVKNTNTTPMVEIDLDDPDPQPELPPFHYLNPLLDSSPLTITIAYDITLPDSCFPVVFDFITRDDEVRGVKISSDIDLEE